MELWINLAYYSYYTYRSGQAILVALWTGTGLMGMGKTAFLPTTPCHRTCHSYSRTRTSAVLIGRDDAARLC